MQGRGGETCLGEISARPPPPWDLYAELEGAILDWNNRHLKRIRQTNQPLSSSGCSRAESKQTGLEGRHVKRQRDRGKGDSWSQTACQKKGAKLCHKCDILASQTVRRWRKLFLPSWAGGSSCLSHHKPYRTQELKRDAVPLFSSPSFPPPVS